MRLSVEDCLTAIETHTRGLGAAAAGKLDARIEHCPDWSMADLVWHLTEVHRFWEYVARTLPSGEPGARPPSERPADDELVAGMLVGAATLVDTLRAADQDAPCWTWGLEENVRFITRHQVQEAAVHHWDAANAVGQAGQWRMEPVAAMDAVEEFLTHSVGNSRWPVPNAEPMGGTLWMRSRIADSGACPTWVITDGADAGTLRMSVYDGDLPDVEGPVGGAPVDPASALLWLYRRVPRIVDDWTFEGAGPDLVERFRAFTFTG